MANFNQSAESSAGCVFGIIAMITGFTALLILFTFVVCGGLFGGCTAALIKNMPTMPQTETEPPTKPQITEPQPTKQAALRRSNIRKV